MKSRLSIKICLSLVLALGVLSCKEDKMSSKSGGSKVDLSEKNVKARYSYAIGTKMANNFKRQNIDIDTSAYLAAMSDVQSGAKLQLNEAEIASAMKSMRETMQAKVKTISSKNKKSGDDYLTTNKAKPGVKVTDTGLQYKIIKPGNDKKPSEEDKVKVHYRGTLVDGTEFDSSYKRGEPAQFPLRGVIPGWTEGLQLIGEGGKIELVIPSDLGYGDRGNSNIPGGSVLLFEIEMISIAKAEEASKKKVK